MTQREFTPSDYLAMLRRHWVLILVLAVSRVRRSGTESRDFFRSRYKSTTLVLVEQPSVPIEISSSRWIRPTSTSAWPACSSKS